MTLLGQIFGFVLVAFVLGAGVGWALHRTATGRRPAPGPATAGRLGSVSPEEQGQWAAAARRQDERLEAERRDQSAANQRARLMLADTRAERDGLRLRLAGLEAELAATRVAADAVAGELAAVQHRLAEQSVHRARTVGVPSGVYVRPQPVPPRATTDAVLPSGPSEPAPRSMPFGTDGPAAAGSASATWPTSSMPGGAGVAASSDEARSGQRSATPEPSSAAAAVPMGPVPPVPAG